MSPSAGAGFPAVIARTGPINTGSVTSHPITVPTHSVGDLLLVTMTVGAAPTVSITSGTGWNTIGPTAQGSNVTGVIYWKVADGSDTLTIGTSTSQESSHRCRVIAAGTHSASATAVTGTATTGAATTNGNPNAHTPPNGADDYLWVVTYHASGATPSVAPTNYTELSTGFTGSSRSNSYAERELNASSENPGAWTCVISNIVMYVLAIEPA